VVRQPAASFSASWLRQVFVCCTLADRAFHQLMSKREQFFRDFSIGRAALTCQIIAASCRVDVAASWFIEGKLPEFFDPGLI
jgi:hypothetical protein